MTGLLGKLKDKSNFSDTEKVISDYITENFRELANLSTRQLAKKTFTSSAAIVRFSQKLGFEGYSDFKTKFVSEMMRNIGKPQDTFISDVDTVNEILEKVFCIEVESLNETHEKITASQFIRALNYLSTAEHIDFYAMDNNLNLARMAAENFIMANKYSSVNTSTIMQFLSAYQIPKTHISFFISRTGENRILNDIAKILHEQDATIFSITSAGKSTLAKLSKVTFEVATTDKMEEPGPRVFLTGAKYVLDVLFALLMAKSDYKEAKRREEWLSKNFKY